MSLSACIKMAYKNKRSWTLGENKPNLVRPALFAKESVDAAPDDALPDCSNPIPQACVVCERVAGLIKPCPDRIEFTLGVIEGNGPILEGMKVNFCAAGYTILLPVFIAPFSSILRNNRFRGLQECGIKLLFSLLLPPRKLVAGNGGNNLLSRSLQKTCSLYIDFLYCPFLILTSVC